MNHVTWAPSGLLHRLHHLILALLACGGVILLLLAADVLAINGTDSLPGKLYLMLPLKADQPLERYTTVAFQPPETPFYPPQLKFLKRLRGLPGDQVTAESDEQGGQMFFINGEPVGRAKPHARLTMEPLAPGPVGRIPEHHYFVWTPHVDSYDSRYADIGWIERSAIVARAYRLF